MAQSDETAEMLRAVVEGFTACEVRVEYSGGNVTASCEVAGVGHCAVGQDAVSAIYRLGLELSGTEHRGRPTGAPV